MAKKGLLQRITMGKDDQPDFEPSKLPGTRMAQFKDIFKNRMSMLFKINFVAAIFFIPLLLWIFWTGLLKAHYGTVLPYNSNIGFGYQVIGGLDELREGINFTLNVQKYAVMIPCIMFAFIGLAGAFYTMKQLAWGEGVTAIGTFFTGIKRNIVQFLFIGFILGGVFFVVMFNIVGYNNLGLPGFVSVLAIIFTILLLVMTIFACIFMTTQAVTYKLSVWKLFKNSYLFAIALVPGNFIMTLAAFGPLLVIMLLGLLIPGISMLLYMFMLFIGIAFVVLVFTQYAHFVYDRFINDKIDDGKAKNRGLYIKTEEEKQKENELKEKKVKQVNKYSNPKKKKAIDKIVDNSTFTALPQSFNRADLERLDKEKQAVASQLSQQVDVDDELVQVIDDELVQVIDSEVVEVIDSEVVESATSVVDIDIFDCDDSVNESVDDSVNDKNNKD